MKRNALVICLSLAGAMLGLALDTRTSARLPAQPVTVSAIEPAIPPSGAEDWRAATAGYVYTFPRDHASHPPYKIEWWYYTGNLETRSGRRFGYQLTFFRVGIEVAPRNPSRWAVRDLFMSHFAISDIERRTFHSSEKLNRAGIGWAGAAEQFYRVWNEDWEAKLDGDGQTLKAENGDEKLDLRLRPEKAEVIHGENGISQKGTSAGNASHYYSLTRLRTTGKLTVAGEEFEVSGLSWMDHEFGTRFLDDQQTGWDWLSIQLDDNRELMIYQLRRADGSVDPRSLGTLVEADGRLRHFRFGEFTLRPSGAQWRSAASGTTYPTEWLIDLPAFALQLQVKATFDNQELRTTESTGVTYWEGSIDVAGRSGDRPIRGRGYLEMTGYGGQNMGMFFH